MTCDRALKRGVMPVQAKANGLQLCKVPPELSDLNALELRLICRHVPFMKMVAFTIITAPRVCTSVPFISTFLMILICQKLI